MNKEKELTVRIGQCKINIGKIAQEQSSLQAELESLKEPPVYSIADRFKKDGRKFLLCGIKSYIVVLVDLGKGSAPEGNVEIRTNNFWHITEEEAGSALKSFTRYWDDKKKIKLSHT